MVAIPQGAWAFWETRGHDWRLQPQFDSCDKLHIFAFKPLMSVYLSNEWLNVMPCKNARWYSIIVRSIITHGFN